MQSVYDNTNGLSNNDTSCNTLIPSLYHPQSHRHLNPHQQSPTINRLPNEILVEIFNHLPTLDQSLDLLSVSLICKRWTAPAQSVLWRYIRFPGVECVTNFAETAKMRPDLARLSKRLNFFTSDPEYLVALDADAVFSAMNSLTSLERFEVTVPYAGGELYDSLCEELAGAPVKEVMLAADEGIGPRHVQASMRFPEIRLLHLVRLGELGDLISLAEDWPNPMYLTELILVKPDLPGEDLKFLLSHTKSTLRVLRLDFEDLTSEETSLTEDDITEALIQSGHQLTELEILCPFATYPFLNQAIVGLIKIQLITTSGNTFDPTLDHVAPESLTRIKFYIPVGFQSSFFKPFEEGSYRRSNLTKYSLETKVKKELYDDDEENVDAAPESDQEWSEIQIQEWKECAKKLASNGITLIGDFF